MWEEFKNYRSQDLNELFHDAGQCYFFNLQKNEEKGILGYELSRFECQDIDTIEDFKFAEFLFGYSRKKIYYESQLFFALVNKSSKI